jgi:hypothetical protein
MKKYTRQQLYVLAKEVGLKGYSSKTVDQLCAMLRNHVLSGTSEPLPIAKKRTKHYRYLLEKKSVLELEAVVARLKMGPFDDEKKKYATEVYKYKYFLIGKILTKHFPLVPEGTNVSDQAMRRLALFRKKLLQKIYQKVPPKRIKYDYGEHRITHIARRTPQTYLNDLVNDPLIPRQVHITTLQGYENMASRFRRLIGADLDGIRVTERWRLAQLEYQKSLPFIDRLVLLTYTYGGDAIVHAHMDKSLRVDKFYDDKYERSYVFPLYPTLLSWMFKDVLRFMNFSNQHMRADMKLRHAFQFDKLVRATRKEAQNLDFGSTAYATYTDILNFFFRPHDNLFHFDTTFYTTLVEMYTTDLQRIISRAPKLDKQLIVYKGVKDIAYLDFSIKNTYTNKRFISTSIDPTISDKSAFTGSNCCMQKIYLLPQTTCLYVYLSYFNEREILLPPGRYVYALTELYTPPHAVTGTVKKKTVNLMVTK